MNMLQKYYIIYYMNDLGEIDSDEWYAKPAETTYFSGHHHFLEGT